MSLGRIWSVVAAVAACVAVCAAYVVAALLGGTWALPLSLQVVIAAVAGGAFTYAATGLLGAQIDRDLRRLTRYFQAAAEGSDAGSPSVGKAMDAFARDAVDSIGCLNEEFIKTGAALREAELRLRIAHGDREHMETVLVALRDGVIVTDGFDEISLANDAAGEILGFDAKEALRSRVEAVIDNEEIRRAIRATRESSVASKRKQMEHSVVVQEGGEEITRTYEIIFSCLPYDKGVPGGVVTILRDVTREREISRMKSDFVAKSSHELRTPLSSINAYVEMLLDGDASDEKSRQEFYGVIKTEADRLGRLIDNMLNISRIEAGIVKLTPTEIDLVKVAKRVVEVLQPQAREKSLSLTLKAGPLSYTAVADEDMVQQVILNLISNAIKYTPASGRVTIEIDNDDATRSVMTTVADNGLGIPPGDIERIFDKFYRVKNYKRVAPGTGLGLNLVKHIVETLHGGTVNVSSELGMGSKFTFTIPYETSMQARDAA